jgi:integrase
MAKAKKGATAVVLSVGATHFPADPGAVPEPIPKGVTIRSGAGVQIEFMWQGRRHTESLRGAPTVEKVREAIAKRETVLSHIERNNFVYAHQFPDSRQVKAAEAAKKQVQQESHVTMRELFSAFLERYGKENPGGGNTLDTHRGCVNSRLLPALGHLRPAEVTKDVVINFRAAMHQEKLSVSRISNVMTPLNGALALAVERELIAVNPIATMSPTKLKLKKTVKLDENGLPSFDEPLPTSLDQAHLDAAKHADPLNAEERAAVLAQLSGQIRNIFHFDIWTGLRSGELIALRWCDVSPDGLHILVRLAFSKNRFTPTKGKRARWVQLLGPAVQIIQAQRALTGEVGRFVFHNPRIDDRWQNSQRLRVHWIRALKAAGVRYRYPYQCRHTYASMMVSAGESPEWVAEQMGHRDGRLVAGVYGRWMRPSKEEPGQKAAKAYAAEWREAKGWVATEDPPVSAQEAAALAAAEAAADGVREKDDEEL